MLISLCCKWKTHVMALLSILICLQLMQESINIWTYDVLTTKVYNSLHPAVVKYPLAATHIRSGDVWVVPMHEEPLFHPGCTIPRWLPNYPGAGGGLNENSDQLVNKGQRLSECVKVKRGTHLAVSSSLTPVFRATCTNMNLPTRTHALTRCTMCEHHSHSNIQRWSPLQTDVLMLCEYKWCSQWT